MPDVAEDSEGVRDPPVCELEHTEGLLGGKGTSLSGLLNLQHVEAHSLGQGAAADKQQRQRRVGTRRGDG